MLQLRPIEPSQINTYLFRRQVNTNFFNVCEFSLLSSLASAALQIAGISRLLTVGEGRALDCQELCTGLSVSKKQTLVMLSHYG